jgi:superfamily I DNA/RNA helicase
MKKTAKWVIHNTRTFARHCSHIPRDVYKAIWGPIADRLEKYPDMPDGNKVKKIERIKNWFAIKVRKDWRLTYKLYYEENVVLLCYIEHKDQNKKRSSKSYRAPNENKIKNTIEFDDQPLIDEIIIDESMHYELEKKPSDKEKEKAKPSDKEKEKAKPSDKEKEKAITRDIKKEKKNRELNSEFKIQEYILRNRSIIREAFRITKELAEELISKAEEKCNDDQLLRLVGDRFASRILEYFYPKNIKEILNEERYEFVRLSEEGLEDDQIYDDIENMLSVMLVLDPTQEEFVDKFSEDNFKGPWLVKGPAGSGKTTVALRSINQIIKKCKNMGHDLPKILFTSHTNALTNTARVLLEEMGVVVESETSHTIAKKVKDAYWTKTKKEKIEAKIPSYFNNFILDKPIAYNFIKIALGEEPLTLYEKRASDETYSSHYEFIYEEFELISGHGLTENEYLDKNSRKEREEKGARILNTNEKRKIWKIYQTTRKLSRNHNYDLCGNEIFPWATQILEELSTTERFEVSYDYIFIDEGQDLTPVAIKFLSSLLIEGSKGLFVAADSSQTMYSTFNSWDKILTTLHLKKDSIVTLNRNHRCTKETWNAVNKMLKDCESIDRSTVFTNEFPGIYEKPERSGDRPKIIEIESKYLDSDKDVDKKFVMDSLIRELKKSQHKHHVGFSGIGFLFRENNDGKLWEKKLPTYLKAKFNKSGTFNPKYQGLHLTSIHGSKGLTYPIIIIPEFREGKIPISFKTRDQDLSTINFNINKQTDISDSIESSISVHNKKILEKEVLIEKNEKKILNEDKSNIKDDINEHYESELVNFFVACTRAQHQLILISCYDKPSKFMQQLDLDDWDIVRIQP